MVDEERKVLTREGGCGSISHALSKRCIPNHARVVELVDSLAPASRTTKRTSIRMSFLFFAESGIGNRTYEKQDIREDVLFLQSDPQ